MASTNVVSLENVRKQYAEKVPLDGVSLGLDAGDRTGVIGINGSGKSTLLKIIARVEGPDSGRVVHRGGLRIRYLDQQPMLEPGLTPLEAAGGSRQAEAYLDKLGLGGITQAVETLSGGQRRRVALAEVLADDPDLLILDEPTNHLDPDVIEWLEGLLMSRSGTLLFVTHDRYLLGRVATRIIEVADGTTYTHHGSYADYLNARAQRVEQLQTEARKRANLAKTELEWLRRGPKARTSKAKYRVDAAEELVEQAAIKVDVRELSISFPSRRLGSRVSDAHSAGKQYTDDRWVVREIELKVPQGARWGFVGPNGSGKTTLLGLMAGRLRPDAGSVRLGETVHVGWYGQEPAPLAERTRVIDAVREVAEEAATTDGLTVSAGDLLERFLFSKPAQRAFVEELSGGERRRLELLRVLADAPNLLILDEPTNDLDLDTLSVLENYLDSWPGALLVASHDRWFLDRVCDDLYAIRPDGTLRHQPGGWTAYREGERQAASRAKAAARSGGSSSNGAGSEGKRSGKLSYNDQREYKRLSSRIPQLEAQRTRLHQQMASAAEDYEAVVRLAKDLDEVTVELEAAESRWLELAEAADG